jgi:3-deoxy-D-manno-octulosonate cytidylyltransferase
LIDNNRILGIIPARLESSRIHQKPLFKVFDIPLVEHVYRRALKSTVLDDLIVATDSQVIVDLIEAIGGKAVLTSVSHRNPTERMCEIMENYDYDYYTLINGDEILLNPDCIKVSIETLLSSDCDVSTLVVPFPKKNSPSDFKAVLNLNNEVMYISRNDIPSDSRNSVESYLKVYHLMTFTPEILKIYSKLSKSPLEKVEDHEHLRLLENGYTIIAKLVHEECVSLDTLEDIPIIEPLLINDPLYNEYCK